MTNALDIVKAASLRASLKSKPAQREAATQFQNDFELVAEHYKLREHQEYEQALNAARDDKAGAKICYAAIAASLRKEGLAVGINERIRARIELEKN